VQGILITPVAGAGERLARLKRRGTAVILVDSRSPTGSQCSVAVDDVLGGDVAMSRLLEIGHERIAYVGGQRAGSSIAELPARQRPTAADTDVHRHRQVIFQPELEVRRSSQPLNPARTQAPPQTAQAAR
jgi:LacI family transcriptional regulator